ncbi:MAG TPA: hypothetical protein VMU08_11035 [Rhizomicrobium sp.]|nr:hypothetical protein [Rhizomicrobium sp.]
MAIVLLALAGCGTHPREVIPDDQTAIATARTFCRWDGSVNHLHAELKGDKWHVWDDAMQNQAFLNRYDSGGTYVCVGL